MGLRADAKSEAGHSANVHTYKLPIGVDAMEEMKRRTYANNSNRKVKWAVKCYVDWRAACIKTRGTEFCDSQILRSDLFKPCQLV